MTHEDYLKSLSDAGFSTQPLWDAKEHQDRYTGVRAYVVYAPDGSLLTSIVIRRFNFTPDRKSHEIAVYFCSENSSVQSDLEELKGLWSRQVRRLARRNSL